MILKLIGKLALVFGVWGIGAVLIFLFLRGNAETIVGGAWLIAFLVTEVLILRGRLWG